MNNRCTVPLYSFSPVCDECWICGQ